MLIDLEKESIIYKIIFLFYINAEKIDLNNFKKIKKRCNN